jgi:hypothetical protein
LYDKIFKNRLHHKIVRHILELQQKCIIKKIPGDSLGFGVAAGIAEIAKTFGSFLCVVFFSQLNSK